MTSVTLAPVPRPERAVFRLRKWIIHRLVSIVDQLHLEKEEALTEQVARCEMDLSLALWVVWPKNGPLALS
jgi:hypothetical protein